MSSGPALAGLFVHLHAALAGRFRGTGTKISGNHLKGGACNVCDAGTTESIEAARGEACDRGLAPGGCGGDNGCCDVDGTAARSGRSPSKRQR